MLDLNTQFCRIQNLHISQTFIQHQEGTLQFCRIQNLHISQTLQALIIQFLCFVEFKIYISLKQPNNNHGYIHCFVEFKIYISLKLFFFFYDIIICFVEFKIYISLKQQLSHGHLKNVLQNSKFTYLSNLARERSTNSSVLQNSKFTYLSNGVVE